MSIEVAFVSFCSCYELWFVYFGEGKGNVFVQSIVSLLYFTDIAVAALGKVQL